MELKRFKDKLLDKERELLADIAALDRDAREPAEGSVGDAVDEATSAALKSVSCEEGSVARETLTLVRDALRRIDEKTFGRCADCARLIEPARLEAVPWTLYCRDDQEKHDAR